MKREMTHYISPGRKYKKKKKRNHHLMHKKGNIKVNRGGVFMGSTLWYKHKKRRITELRQRKKALNERG